MLHITNGSSVSWDRSGIGGEIVLWVDVLHEGPVPAGLELEELSRVRAAFLDSQFPNQISAADGLARRDAALQRFAEHEEIVLWFEHDLYDQLQIIQILDWFHGRDTGATRLSLICVDRYLGRLSGEQLAALWPDRHAVTPAELELAACAWQAFRSPDPAGLEELLRTDTSALPFLAGALLRHLQQFPSVENGLSRTERQILEAAGSGNHKFESLFQAEQKLEERIFMGDCTLFWHLRRLVDCRVPLLEEKDGYRLTEAGRDVLAGRADHIQLSGIDRWLGGVYLRGGEPLWRWDERGRRLVTLR